MKPIVLSDHARDQIEHRGATEDEVIEAITTCPWTPAEGGRMECRLGLVFNAEWNRRRYEAKVVRPIFVEEDEAIVVVTVYVYYEPKGGVSA